MKLEYLSVYIIVSSLCPPIHSISREYKVKRTKYGKIKGYINDIKDVGKVERYLGVPYARPPIGIYRFEHAEDPVPWGDETIATTKLSPACYQRHDIYHYLDQHYPNFRRQNEDCLYINIYVPAHHQRNQTKSVLFHIHGGSNGYGMGSMLHGDVLAMKADVIVVTFNYRLGVFGFFGSNSKIFRGNYGMTDQVKALRWVQENIHYFGGDKNKVTITGHSAGGCDVGLHIISPLSKGLFRYAVMMSGSPLAYWCVEENSTFIEENFSDFSNATGCLDITNDVSTMKECLKKVDSKTLTNRKVASRAGKYFQFGVNIGDEFLPYDPRNLLNSGQLNGDSFMVGLTSLEGAWAATNANSHDIRKFIKANLYFTPLPKQFDSSNIDVLEKVYFSDVKANNSEDAAERIGHMIGDFVFNIPAINVADAIASRDETLYFYRFDHKSENSTSKTGVAHGEDLFYFFGSPFTGHHHLDYNDEDRIVSNSYIHMFSSFVKNGKPSMKESDVSIPTYTSRAKNFFRINSSNGRVDITLDRNYREQAVLYWNKCLETVSQGRASDCVSSGESKRVHYLIIIYVLALFCV